MRWNPCTPLLALLLAVLAACQPGTSPGPHSGSTAAAGAHVAWFEGSFDEALKQAQVTKRLVFIDFFTTWCPPCKKLEKETFTDKAVIEELAGMVPLSIDAESNTGAPLAQRYSVAGYPTLLVLDAGGQEVGRMVGFAPPTGFLAELRAIRARVKR